MSRAFREASKISKLVALGASPNQNEAAAARAKARGLLVAIDLEYLETLSGQREKLRADITLELNRLYRSKTRPNAGTTRLVERAGVLLMHYEKADALPAAIQLLRQEIDAQSDN